MTTTSIIRMIPADGTVADATASAPPQDTASQDTAPYDAPPGNAAPQPEPMRAPVSGGPAPARTVPAAESPVNVAPVVEDPAPAAPLVRGLAAALGKVEAAARLADPVEMVHDARKALKGYRALLKLLSSPEAKAARAAAAEVARSLSGARDQAAALESLAALKAAGLLDEADVAAAATALAGAPESGPEAEAHRAALRAFIADARLRLAYGLDGQAAAADLAAGIRRTYRKARRADWTTPAAMHETRKSVVAHRYQMGFLVAFAGIAADERARQMQKLRDLFGAYQDIATLRPMIAGAAPSLDAAVRVRLDAAMDWRQQDLKAAAREMHAGLFERRPRAFLRDLHLKRARTERAAPARRPKIVRRVRIVRPCKGCKRR